MWTKCWSRGAVTLIHRVTFVNPVSFVSARIHFYNAFCAQRRTSCLQPLFDFLMLCEVCASLTSEPRKRLISISLWRAIKCVLIVFQILKKEPVNTIKLQCFVRCKNACRTVHSARYSDRHTLFRLCTAAQCIWNESKAEGEVMTFSLKGLWRFSYPRRIERCGNCATLYTYSL